MAREGALLLLLALMGCSAQFVQGPRLDASPRIIQITSEPLNRRAGETPVVIKDQERINTALRLFAAEGWERNDGELVPVYRINLLREDGRLLTYWVGTFSHPPRFPCYWMCSGFWVAASGPDGKFASHMRKRLAASNQMFALSGLLPTQPKRTD